ncbi:Asp23/Gls24 family envelope stress response protein [Peptostreptococcus equinus]|uniref:Asp23/Gls24 family envelope stress response protein n=1 Tax=Peptostreptococcus equinus TaxID=3003601 RepID=A0ABY7JM25_9FIRM|nr:Asp23/Gls24 family envelope stress response protein [Peptostreptococcus sp. CBA3647]WAW14209.1 Asp23/Gls24 family envelope stress response protein [Peptostreptococcus sp. CBA3647]
MENLGQVRISNDVIQTIAGFAALEIDGIDKSTSFTDKLFRNNGIKVEIENNQAIIDMGIQVNYGEVIPEVCRKVQENITNAVENMAGLSVSQVNIHVESMGIKKERDKKDNE